MKKHLLPGAVLSISLLLSGVVYANSVRATSDTAALQKAEQPGSPAKLEKSAPTQPNGPSRTRLASDSPHDAGARWSWVDQNSKTEVMAFTSTAAANNAVTMMSGSGSLSFASFGRVPFYQILTLTNQVTTNSLAQSVSSPTASLPEPATLTLLGAGLAALAAGLRKKNKKPRREK